MTAALEAAEAHGGRRRKLPIVERSEGERRRWLGRLDAVEKGLTVLPFVGHGSGRGRRSGRRCRGGVSVVPVITASACLDEGGNGQERRRREEGTLMRTRPREKGEEITAAMAVPRAKMAEASAALRGRSGAGKKRCEPLDFIQRSGEAGVAWGFPGHPMAIGRWGRGECGRVRERAGGAAWAEWSGPSGAGRERRRDGLRDLGPKRFEDLN